MDGETGTALSSIRAVLGPRHHKLALLLVSLFALSYALFTQDVISHNTLCRAALTAHLVQNGRVDINGFENLTRDKAFREGNHYCDKAPGMSFLAAPTALVFTQFAAVTPETPYGRVWLAFLYLIALTTSGILCAVAAVMLYRYVLLRTKDLHAALISSIAFGLGTPVWGWATSYFSHAATAALLVIGFVTIDEARRRLATREPASALALVGGLSLGAAIGVEYSTAVPAAIIGASALITSDWGRPLAVLKFLAIAGMAGLMALVPVLIYHDAAFGSPFTTGYRFAAFYEGTRSGLFGINMPRLDVLGQLLVGADRGVLWYAPIVVMSAWAMAMMLRHSELRVPAIVTILIFAFYLALNAGFVYWRGGASSGPRYLTPAIGFSMLALGLSWPYFGPWLRRATLLLLSLSVFINFATTAVDMTAGALISDVLPSFFSGDLRHTLTYRLYKQPSIIHFALPVLAAFILGWLIAREVKQAHCSRSPEAGATPRSP